MARDEAEEHPSVQTGGSLDPRKERWEMERMTSMKVLFHAAAALVLAWIFFLGTFAIGGEFYFPERVDLISFVLALALCWTRSAPPDGEAPLGQVDHEGAAEAPATFARDR